MNDTTNTTPGIGVMPNSTVPATPAMPEVPSVQPFGAAPSTPAAAPMAAAPSIPSFGATEPSSAPAASTPPAWSAPTPPAPTQNAFSTPAPTPVAGSASWGTPAPSSTAPAWSAPAAPVSPIAPPVASATSDFKPEGKSKLPLIIAGILLILAMAGGYFLYMLYQTPTTTEVPVAAQPEVTPTATPSPTMTEDEQTQQEINALKNVSESDEVESLQQDVDNTNLTNIDSGLTPAAQ